MSNTVPRDSTHHRQALRHRSAGLPHYERLEFLGDSLLNFFIAEALFQRWPKADEGALTRARAQLVREATLADIAKGLNLGERIELGPGEMKSGGHRRDSILADVLEALIAATYLEHGMEAARAQVLEWFAEAMQQVQPNQSDKDAKTRLQEWLQGRGLPRPVYALAHSEGEDHARVFHVTCVLEQPALRGEGSGPSMRAAEQQAAAKALELVLLESAASKGGKR